MSAASHVSLAPEANSTIVDAISRILSADFRESTSPLDLRRRLAAKGFTIQRGYLATAPHGKLICPVSAI